jgi:hypothetical protein
MAQPKYSEYRVIPTTTDSATGTIKWLEKRANGTNSFAWAAPDTLAADVIMKWPTMRDGVPVQRWCWEYVLAGRRDRLSWPVWT